MITKQGKESIWFTGGVTVRDASDLIWRFTPKDSRMIQMGRMLRARFLLFI